MSKKAASIDVRARVFHRAEPYLYAFPAVFLIVLFSYYPFVKSVYLSTTLVNQMGTVVEHVGLENYARILGNKAFQSAVANTFTFVLIVVPSSILIALGLALLANRRRRLSPVYETMFTIPMAISVSITVLIFQFMLNPSLGIINQWLGLRVAWFTDKRYLLWAVSFVQIWLNIAFDFLFLLSAIRGVSQDVMEASQMEGANALQRTRYIVLPLISPTIFFILCTELTKSMMLVAPLIIINYGSPMASGGTQTIMYYVYNQAFVRFNYSYAFTGSVIGFFLTFGVILTSFLYEKKGVHYS